MLKIPRIISSRYDFSEDIVLQNQMPLCCFFIICNINRTLIYIICITKKKKNSYNFFFLNGERTFRMWLRLNKYFGKTFLCVVLSKLRTNVQ